MKILVGCAVLAGLVIDWFGFAVTGWSGLVWSACAVLAFVAFAGRFGLDEVPPTGRPDEVADLGQGGRYPQYERLATEMRHGLRDGRYFARVLAPDLRHIAHEIAAHRRGRGLSDEQLAVNLSAEVWGLLTVDPHSRDRDDVPSVAEVAMILSAVEGL